MARYIFITGGVVSSLGKGLASAALGALLQARGYRVRLRKLDPYLNVDPGTMSPYQHGEVLSLTMARKPISISAITSASPAGPQPPRQHHDRSHLSGDPRQGAARRLSGRHHPGGPHVTNAIKDFIRDGNEECDFVLCEIGGTVGDIEGLPFFEAIRQLGNDLPRHHAIYIHLTLLPFITGAGELKTKPTQHSVKELRSIGIQPDILLCRSDRPIPKEERRKLGLFCNVRESAVIEALEVDNIYAVPEAYQQPGSIVKCLRRSASSAGGPTSPAGDWINERIRNPEGDVTIAIVGKYTGLKDAYKSLIEALPMVEFQSGQSKYRLDRVGSVREAIRPLSFNMCTVLSCPEALDSVAPKARSRLPSLPASEQVPYFGICFGMQMAVIEAARTLRDKGREVDRVRRHPEPVVGLMTEWMKGNERQMRGRG